MKFDSQTQIAWNEAQPSVWNGLQQKVAMFRAKEPLYKVLILRTRQRVGFHIKCPQSLLISTVEIQQIQIRLKLLVQSL